MSLHLRTGQLSGPGTQANSVAAGARRFSPARKDFFQVAQILPLGLIKTQRFLAFYFRPLLDLDPSPITDGVHGATDLA